MGYNRVQGAYAQPPIEHADEVAGTLVREKVTNDEHIHFSTVRQGSRPPDARPRSDGFRHTADRFHT